MPLDRLLGMRLDGAFDQIANGRMDRSAQPAFAIEVDQTIAHAYALESDEPRGPEIVGMLTEQDPQATTAGRVAAATNNPHLSVLQRRATQPFGQGQDCTQAGRIVICAR